jgi:hypothetical protein
MMVRGCGSARLQTPAAMPLVTLPARPTPSTYLRPPSQSAAQQSPGATNANTSTVTLTPAAGFTGSVALTASLTSSPTGAQYLPTLSFGSTSPVNIAGATAGTATLTVTTTAATSSALLHPRDPGARWYAGGGAVLACLLLFGIPARRRNSRTMLGLFMLLAHSLPVSWRAVVAAMTVVGAVLPVLQREPTQ